MSAAAPDHTFQISVRSVRFTISSYREVRLEANELVSAVSSQVVPENIKAQRMRYFKNRKVKCIPSKHIWVFGGFLSYSL